MADRRLNLNALPLAGGIGLGAAVALAFLLMPGDWLGSVVEASGIAALIPAAAPPLGIAGRAALALSLGGGAGAVAWSALFLLFGPGGVFHRPERRDGVPAVRRADAHPDAPPRKPFSAADFGLPIEGQSPLPERNIPDDLDQPLADFDPDAIPAAPREPVRPVPSVAETPEPAPLPIRTEPLGPGERIKSVKIGPPYLPADEAETPSIEALLARLERGAAKRAAAR